MLTRLRIRNFKRFTDADIELGQAVVFIGPNNSGKTTALQALALWEIGLRRWLEKRSADDTPEKRAGVAINRKDISAIPVPNAKLLWRDLKAHQSTKKEGKTTTGELPVEISVSGVTDGKVWECGLEFSYANEESVYVRPLRTQPDGKKRMTVPNGLEAKVAFLPPMSGLVDREFSKQPGEIAFLIGQGQTAQVLRNLCHRLHFSEDKSSWEAVKGHILTLFGVTLADPEFTPERSEIVMSYTNQSKTLLDLSSTGRGLQQTLLLLAYLYSNPKSVLLLDEPDAHLEILRQRQTYSLLRKVAESQGSQIICASHSEAVLNTAAGSDIVVSFVRSPKRIDHRGRDAKKYLVKALSEYGFDQYYQAEQTRWVLYLEGSTDLDILKGMADLLGHSDAAKALDLPFVHFVGNDLSRAFAHFAALQDAIPDLSAVAVLDRRTESWNPQGGFTVATWKRNEIENYICLPEVLDAYAAYIGEDDMFAAHDSEKRRAVMKKIVQDRTTPAALRNRNDPFWYNVKASDDYLDVIFKDYFKELELPQNFRKSSYYSLTRFMQPGWIDPEVNEKLDLIAQVYGKRSQDPTDKS